MIMGNNNSISKSGTQPQRKQLTEEQKQMLIKRSNIRYGMSLFQYISHKTGRKPCECTCLKCKSQCHTPCLGTPQDILKLIEAGYGDKLELSGWAVGVFMGVCDHTVAMVQAKVVGDWCAFYDPTTGLCTIHDKGLKPTEGKLSSHKIKPDNWIPKKSISWNVAKEWMDDRNSIVIREIVNYFAKQDNHSRSLIIVRDSKKKVVEGNLKKVQIDFPILKDQNTRDNG